MIKLFLYDFCLEVNFSFFSLFILIWKPFGKDLYRIEIQSIDLQSRLIDWFLYGATLLQKGISRGVSRTGSDVRSGDFCENG